MKVIAVNGSPRKKWNTATLLEKALEGADSVGAATELVHLYDLDYKGCRSCFACKKRGGRSYGRCASKDGLSPLLARIGKTADALLLGSPIYFGDVTGALRSFMERLLFPYLVYSDPPQTLRPRTIASAWIYTMNVSEELAGQWGYGRLFEANAQLMQRILGPCRWITSYDTYQFDDYAKVVADRFNILAKEQRRMEFFPKDCRKAFDLGAALAA